MSFRCKALFFIIIPLFSVSVIANDADQTESADQVTEHANSASTDAQDSNAFEEWGGFSADVSLDIKRQIMSRPGVFLDMGNLTDNRYVWTNDVVWEGSDLPTNEKWHIAAFLFQREGYKAVWLQYAFTFDEASGKVVNFQRWYGAVGFR